MPTRFNIKETLDSIEKLNIFASHLALRDKNKIEKLNDKYKELLSNFSNNKAYSKRHQTYNHVFLLNGYSCPKFLHKYIGYDNFIKSAQGKYMVFVSPCLWQDPLELIYYKTDYGSYDYSLPDIACLCTTENSNENEDASWRIYANNSNEKVLRININVDNLLSQLNQYANDNNCNIYIGKMIYDFSRQEILQLHTDANSFFKNQFFFKPFTNDNYLSLMCLKRKSYLYENEVRIFIVKNANSKILYRTPFLGPKQQQVKSN